MQSEDYHISKIAELIKASKSDFYHDDLINYIITDSRKIIDAEKSLFFALKGRRDGHLFIHELLQKGVSNFVLSDAQFAQKQHPKANFLLVEDVLAALQLLAAGHRSQFNYPVIGITGSNGKTIVKEWLFQLLSPNYQIIRSPKSYNSQIGVPLSVWQMKPQHELGIFEAGISQIGEMLNLQSIIQPDIGILTHIGTAHDSGFLDVNQKITEKLLLFKNAKWFIHHEKDLNNFAETLPGKNIFSIGESQKNDLRILEIKQQNQFSEIKLRYKSREMTIKSRFSTLALIDDVLVCVATMLILNFEESVIKERVLNLSQVQMRLELKAGINNTTIIDDSYNSDINSLIIALDFLQQQNQHKKRTLILSDILQTGLPPDELYKQIAALLKTKNVDRLIGIGKDISAHKQLFSANDVFFDSTDDFLEHRERLQFSSETILLKGARDFAFERISQILSQKIHETVLEINLNALEANLNFYKSKLKPNTKIMAMVKASSYGSGSFEIANILQFNKVDYLAVAYADEGISLRNAGITMPIMVLNPGFNSFETIIAHQLEPEIYSFSVLDGFLKVLEEKQLFDYPIHLKIDTGMHRLGFELPEIDQLCSIIKNNKNFCIKTIFSHLVASEAVEHDDFTEKQIRDFRAVFTSVQRLVNYKIDAHIANTSAISRWPDAQLDMVRIGIGLYGFDAAIKKGLQTVMVLKTTIAQIKTLNKGETIGYGRAGVMPADGKIATVKIGYADGYWRKFGNGKAKMLVNGVAAFTIGNICMDMCMLNITGIDAQEGDEVIVFNEQISIQELAKIAETIPYDVLTHISARVKRVYYYE